MNEQRPNILMIMTDQQRQDSLGCYGVEGAHTPNLDQMAKNGIIFDNHYVPNPICTPSRACMWTGKHLPGHGVYRLYDNLPEDEILFSERLQKIGYQTALFGKLHVSSRVYEAAKRHPHDGFDIYEWCMEASIEMDSPFNGYTQWLKKNDPQFLKELKNKKRQLKNFPQEVHFTHWAAQRTQEYIQEWNGAKPFFCVMSVFDPHNPYDDYPKEMLKLLDKDKIPEPNYHEDEIEQMPEDIKGEHRHSYLGFFRQFSKDDIKEMRIGYFASLAFLDQEVGKIFDTLEKKGIAENTLVIFTSDHGDMLGDHQLMVKGAFFYDPSVKVPLIFRWPKRIKKCGKRSQLVQIYDLAATVLSAAGYSQKQIQKWMPESKNLLPLIEHKNQEVHEEVFCCYRETGINDQSVYFDPAIYATMIRDKQYKLNVYHHQDNQSDYNSIPGQLFDMENDPQEFHNLWYDPDYQQVKERLLLDLLDWEVKQEVAYRGTRGGDSFPDKSKRLNNKL